MKTYRFLAFLLFHGLCVNTTFMMAQEIRLKPAAALIQHYHQSHVTFAQPQLFKPSIESGSELKPVLRAVTMLDLDNAKLQTLVTTANGAIELRIPFGTGVLALELVKVNLFTEDFKVETNQ